MLGFKIKSEGINYFYDTPTNMVIKVPPENLKDEAFVQYLQDNYNLLQDHKFQEFTFGKLDPAAYKKINHIVINMTNECNFRCVYCKYSGDYEDVPEHHEVAITTPLMDKVLAFMKTLDMGSHFSLGFYGGEPLLEFGKIQRFVEEVKETFPETTFNLAMTTNGSFIGRENVYQFLIDHNFFLTVSLDGPEESSKYRIFTKGRPSFDVVYNNILKLKSAAPEYFNTHVGYSAVFAPPVDLDKIFPFFAGDDIFTEGPMFFSGIDAGSNFEKDHQTDEDFKRLKAQIAKYKDLYIEYLVNEDFDSNLFKVLNNFFRKDVQFLHDRQINESKFFDTLFPVGNCEPALLKLFVSSEGKFHLCEKETVFLSFGDLDQGLNFEKLEQLQDDFVEMVTENGCLQCPFVRMCTVCMAVVSSKDGFSKERLKSACGRSRRAARSNMDFYLRCIDANKEYFNVKNIAPTPV